MPEPMRFGEALRRWREHRGMPLSLVASLLDVPVGIVESWESGEDLPREPGRVIGVYANWRGERHLRWLWHRECALRGVVPWVDEGYEDV